MLFFDAAFFVFLLITTLACLLARTPRTRVPVLLAASYTFYAAWNWHFLFLIFASTSLDFLVGRALPGAAAQWRKPLLVASLVGNLGILAVFKYLDFGVEALRLLLGVDWPIFDLTLPVGISFFTFQSMSYTIDVYRGELRPEPSFLRFALFVGFFPQLVAGPIIRARVFLPQIDSALDRFPNRLAEAIPLFVLGLVKKVVVADNLALLVDPVYANPAAANAADVLLATLAFAGQIYCDFSGYTDMALALGIFFGFRFPQNFRSPYLATGPQDFWRRWHISLSTWLRDYLYVPLGGSRHGQRRMLVALAVTMLLGGLWHGAAWTFVAWGAYHGALLVGQRIARESAPRITEQLAPLAALLFFPLTLFGWMLFRSTSLESVGSLIAALVRPGAPTLSVSVAALAISFIAVEHVLGEWGRRSGWHWEKHPRVTFALAGLALPLCLLLRPLAPTPFIYFQF